MNQQGDVYLFQTNDDGNICVSAGVVEMRGSLETMVYLCLFGGNEKDDGLQDNKFTWWGNLTETDISKKYISRTQNLLRGLPLSVANLNKVIEAVKADTTVFLTENIASSVDVSVSIPAVDTLKIKIDIVADEREQEIEFILVWKRDIE